MTRHEPYRRLACAVVLRAVSDATGISASRRSRNPGRLSVREQKRACDFIRNGGIDFWCHLADRDPDQVREFVQENSPACAPPVADRADGGLSAAMP